MYVAKRWLFTDTALRAMRSSDYAMPFVLQRLAAIGTFWSYYDDQAHAHWRRCSLGGPLMYHYLSLSMLLGVKAYVYIFLHPLGWEEY